MHKPYYTQDDIDGLAHLGSCPGESPFVRGPFESMYRQKPWTIRQYTGFAGADASNAAFKRTLAEGGQGLSVAFDLATHLGFDSDHPTAQADVGRTGVAIDSVEDMKRLFDGIDLSQVSVSMTMNGAVLPIMAAFIVAAEERGVARHQLRGTIQNDILKEFMVRNTYIFEPEPSMRICTDVVEYLSHELPNFNSMSISGYHFQEAGADPALELALTLANARAYLDRIAARGLDLDHFCHRLSFFFGVGMNFFNEIAKLRAARLLWSEEVERRGARSERAKRMKMHCQTSGWSLTAQEPQNNLIRTTIEAMAGVFGGTQSLHTNAYDEALSLPSEHSARLARNTQLILQQETGICEVADPWGGSYMMESMTKAMADRVRAYLAQIDAQGGILQALQSGWVSEQIQTGSLHTQSRIDTGQQAIIGVNRFVSDEPTPSAALLKVEGSAVLNEQRTRIAHLKQSRDGAAVEQALARLAAGAAQPGTNLLALTIDAIRVRATVGECTQALLGHMRRYHADSRFLRGLYAADRRQDTAWRRLERQVKTFGEGEGHAPAILLVKLGLDGHDRGIQVVASGLKDAGFEVDMGPLFSTPEQVCKMLKFRHYDALGVSILSGAHLPLIEQLVGALRENRLDAIPLFVGGIIPETDTAALQDLGVSLIFSPGTRMEVIGESILNALAAVRCHCAEVRAPYISSDR
ncbi:methylmalonyl-CoA mutase [Marinobacterium zhoushanense]|uniref:Methylmalonyl-CoA mutase n=1 Tax=Marinobacterium zhoushanense TaxID=1679163 RepID=A0ABQ1K320_9GAMM|nr:methylmalonyl-CoA mutase [Marinobacterium zhoushanense]GGB85611.1 methylmalonyl-CoA mutase [Marinobacterium zhoushanense]